MLECNHLIGEEEFHLISQTSNPAISPTTKFIWILSSRHDITGEHVNCPKEAKNYFAPEESTQSLDKDMCDIQDDYKRIEAAIHVARNIVAKNACKPTHELLDSDYEKFAPYIIYNGWPQQNTSLILALQQKQSIFAKVNFPASKFLIFDMPHDQQHTGGQFTSLDEKVKSKTDPCFQDLQQNCNVTIVTSAYHVPRVRRLLHSKIYPNPFTPGTNISFYAIDRQYQRPCAQRDIKGELARLQQYLDRGLIGEAGKSNWYSFASLKKWTPLRYTQSNVGASTATTTVPLDFRTIPKKK